MLTCRDRYDSRPLHPGSAKTGARDAAVIADAARSLPHTLRALRVDDETVAALTVLSGFDDYLAGQITATSNRIRGVLTPDLPGAGTGPGSPPGPSRRAHRAQLLHGASQGVELSSETVELGAGRSVENGNGNLTDLRWPAAQVPDRRFQLVI